MDHHWLITWTCYGQWLPGDARGFVGNVRDKDGIQVNHDVPGTPFDADFPGLEAYVLQHMKGDPVKLDKKDAGSLICQYQETAQIRKWKLHAASVMFNHTHVIVGVPGDPDPQSILETLKSWATRSLNKHRELPHRNVLHGQRIETKTRRRRCYARWRDLRREKTAQSVASVVRRRVA